MATLRQIEANRLNAQKSTGPRTPQGKAVSSQNALQSGFDAESQFVTGEDRTEFAALQSEYIARFQPLIPEERFQVDTLIRNEWILRRLFRAEAQLWEYHALRADRSEGVPLGEALVAGNEVFRRLQRRITLAEHSYKDAFAELERLQRARRSRVGVLAAGEPDRTTPDQPPPDDRTESGSSENTGGCGVSSGKHGRVLPVFPVAGGGGVSDVASAARPKRVRSSPGMVVRSPELGVSGS